MSKIQELYDQMIDAMNVDGLQIPIAGVKFYKQGETFPRAVLIPGYHHESVAPVPGIGL